MSLVPYSLVRLASTLGNIGAVGLHKRAFFAYYAQSA